MFSLLDGFITTGLLAFCIAVILLFIEWLGWGSPYAWKRHYYRSSYFKQTHRSFNTIIHDKGLFGEYLIYDMLQCQEQSGGRFLFNLYLPRGGGETTEVDVVLICSKGIFVFESKNYDGWIFGRDTDKYWTQTLRGRRGQSHKEQFFNPIMQNKLHIRCLKNVVGRYVPVFSVIVFGDNCELRSIDISSTPSNCVVTQRHRLFLIMDICESATSLSCDQIETIYRQLRPYTQASKQTKQQHIQNVKKRRN